MFQDMHNVLKRVKKQNISCTKVFDLSLLDFLRRLRKKLLTYSSAPNFFFFRDSKNFFRRFFLLEYSETYAKMQFYVRGPQSLKSAPLHSPPPPYLLRQLFLANFGGRGIGGWGLNVVLWDRTISINKLFICDRLPEKKKMYTGVLREILFEKTIC